VRASLPRRARGALLLLAGAALAFVAGAFFFYPAWATLRTAYSPETRATAQPPELVRTFEGTAARYSEWARNYLDKRVAASADSEDVALTEWPMFGSVFFLVTAEELSRSRSLEVVGTTHEAIRLAAEVVSHPTTSTWVQVKWGSSYLERENVFYRMLLILGLSSYESLTHDNRYAATLRTQTTSLTRELLLAPLHLADDYPGECYPNDVLWAVAALKRASALGYGSREEVNRLARGVLATLNGPAAAPQGLPAFEVDAATGEPHQPARGSASSGLLSMAGELDPHLASRWFDRYVAHYWADGWLRGFREVPLGTKSYEDVDSGPIVFGVGSVATGFGIGAARSVGRLDYAVPLTMQTVPASWPTPFGLLLPGALGWAAADGWCFGELALLFSMTRPSAAPQEVPYRGGVPALVWVFLALFLAGAGVTTWCAARLLRKGWQALRQRERGLTS
jgi:hypothetical protein